LTTLIREIEEARNLDLLMGMMERQFKFELAIVMSENNLIESATADFHFAIALLL
jgi:hypothetical protein